MKNLFWKVAGIGAAALATMVANQVANGTWKFTRGDNPPSDVNDPEIDAKEAIAFALLSGAIVGTARLAANRGVAKARMKAVGEYDAS